jgi:hypothetical protein
MGTGIHDFSFKMDMGLFSASHSKKFRRGMRLGRLDMLRSSLTYACLIGMLTPAFAAGQEQCHSFDDFHVEHSFHGPYVEPNIDQTPEIRRFRTVIRAGAKGKPNFAGYLRLISWGCGSNCHNFALVDKRNGKIFIVDIPAGLGTEFRIDSRLLVADPPAMIREGGPPGLFETSFYVWDRNSETLRQLRMCH